MAASDLHILQAALLLPPEHRGDVRRRACSRTPIPALLGGLLSKNEAGQLALRPRPPLKQWEYKYKYKYKYVYFRRTALGWTFKQYK